MRTFPFQSTQRTQKSASMNSPRSEKDDDDGLEDFPIWSGPCGSDDAPPKLVQCKKVLAAWAIGAGPFTYPSQAGLSIGGKGFNRFVMLEVHYNNQNLEKGSCNNTTTGMSRFQNCDPSMIREFH